MKIFIESTSYVVTINAVLLVALVLSLLGIS
jgi:hypothetical protein